MKTGLLVSIIVSAMLESTLTHDFVLNDRLDVSVTIPMSDYGRHIVLHDACTIANKTYLVGGATSLHSSAVGMDAFLFVYDGISLEEVHSYGGVKEDQFTQVACGDTLVVAGHSNSSDFLNVAGVNNFSRAFVLELDYNGDVLNQFVTEYAFESLIHGLHVSEKGIFAVGQAKRITRSDFLIMHISEQTLSEQVIGGDGLDVLYDVHVGEEILVVGQTSSSEYNATGPRGIQLVLRPDLSVQRTQLLLTSSQSAYHYVDETYLAGTSANQGIVQRRGDSNVSVIDDSTLIHGRHNLTWYGVSQTGGFVQDQPVKDGAVVAVVPNFIVLQHEGMLFEASLVIPHVFRHEDEEYFYNDQPLQFEQVEYWDGLEFHQQQVAVAGPYRLIVEHQTTRVQPSCNVTPQVYYHPVTVLCNTSFVLNDVAHSDSAILNQPGTYRLIIDETEIIFSIEQMTPTLIDVDYQSKQVIEIPEKENRMWMIPAAWFGLFVGKKYLG